MDKKTRSFVRRFVLAQSPKVSNARIARHLGIDAATVSRVRKAHGIVSEHPRAKRLTEAERKAVVNALELGLLSALTVANLYGLSENTVARIRREEGLEPAKRRTRSR